MSLVATSKGNDIDPIPAGVYFARCYAVIDLGTQTIPAGSKGGQSWQEKQLHKILISWELPQCRMEFQDEETGEQKDLPRAISAKYTCSVHSKAKLRAVLDSWRGVPFTPEEAKGFDLSKLINAPCQIQVSHTNMDDGRIWANVENVMALPNGVTVPPLENDQIIFTIEAGIEHNEIPESIPDWIADLIRASEEWKEAFGQPEAPATVEEAVTQTAAAFTASKEPPPPDEDDVPF